MTRLRSAGGGAAALVLAVLPVLVLDATGAEGAKGAQPPPLSVTDRSDGLGKKLLAQQPLLEAASAVRWAVERGDSAGFTGVALRDDEIEVLWKGSVPAALSTAIAEARHIAPVRIKSAPYSLAELTRAADAIVQQMRANPTGAIHAVEVPSDGTGIVVAVDRYGSHPIVSKASVPVRVVKRARISVRSRMADTPPFWGAHAWSINTTGRNARRGLPSRTPTEPTGYSLPGTAPMLATRFAMGTTADTSAPHVTRT